MEYKTACFNLSSLPSRFESGLGTLIEKTISKGSDCYKIKTKIRSVLKELNFNKKRLKLNVSDPSYKLRYQYALDFWREKTRNDEIEIALANVLIDELTEELNSEECVYPEANGSKEIFERFFFQVTSTESGLATKQGSVDEKTVWYVTSKCDNKFYVKSANNCEAEIEIKTREIPKGSYKRICPGDEVKIISSSFGEKRKIQITKYVIAYSIMHCNLKYILYTVYFGGTHLH
jgi:6-pyruvoyl-tetrahydropterin synthase